MELIEIGKMGKPYGTEGLLRCFIADPYLADFLDSEFLFVKLNGQAVPFFIEGAEGDGNGIHLQMEDIEDREAASDLAGKIIYLRREDMGEPPEVTPSDDKIYTQWLGYHLKDLTLGDIGPIESFEELPQQILAVVSYRGGEVMIPSQEQLILENNPADKTILMDLPAGLLEL